MNLTTGGGLLTAPAPLQTQRRLLSTLTGPSGNLVAAAAQQRLANTQQMYQQQLLSKVQQLQQRLQQNNMNDLVYRGPVGQPPMASMMPAPKGNLNNWIMQALAATHLQGQGLRNGLNNMIMHESGGRYNAVNNWDSNAKAGTPSIGLMQTIQPTFNAYAMPGHRNIYNPVDNIIAGLRYAISRYGKGMVRAGGRHDSRGNYIGY